LRPRGTLRQWVAPIFIALLCARALIPAGVMLAPIGGQLEVVLCDADAANALRHPGGHEHSGHHHSATDPTCPYAQSAGPAPLPSLPVVAASPIVVVPLAAAFDSQIFSTSGPARQQSPRGPPFLT
jgi:hypothetical protein